jgi:hypothetical protein
VGSGNTIDIWEDNWIHQKGSSSTWSTRPEANVYTKVKDLMKTNSNDWEVEIVKKLFIPYEAQQILNIPILDKNQDDIIT